MLLIARAQQRKNAYARVRSVRLHVMRLSSVSPRSYQLEAAVHSLIRVHAQRAGIDRSEADGFFHTLRTNALRAAMQVDFPTDDL